jgi:hypothetical protein
VTTGAVVVVVGDELPVLPVVPVLPVDELLDVAVPPVPDEVAVVPEVLERAEVLTAPGWACATAIPIAAAAPVAEMTAPRVRWRNRDCALALFSGVCSGGCG